MIIIEIALRVVNFPEDYLFEDSIEAYQLLNDWGHTDKLNNTQKKILEDLIESGIILTEPIRLT